MTAFFYWLGHFAQDVLFYPLELVGNLPNWFFIVFAFVLLGWWMKLQKKYNDEAAADAKQLK
ncbi:MAG: hypothetical protein ACPGSL_00960 [Vicingaceae bacterium]